MLRWLYIFEKIFFVDWLVNGVKTISSTFCNIVLIAQTVTHSYGCCVWIVDFLVRVRKASIFSCHIIIDVSWALILNFAKLESGRPSKGVYLLTNLHIYRMLYLQGFFGPKGWMFDFLALYSNISVQVGIFWASWLFAWEENLLVVAKFCLKAFC